MLCAGELHEACAGVFHHFSLELRVSIFIRAVQLLGVTLTENTRSVCHIACFQWQLRSTLVLKISRWWLNKKYLVIFRQRLVWLLRLEEKYSSIYSSESDGIGRHKLSNCGYLIVIAETVIENAIAVNQLEPSES